MSNIISKIVAGGIDISSSTLHDEYAPALQNDGYETKSLKKGDLLAVDTGGDVPETAIIESFIYVDGAPYMVVLRMKSGKLRINRLRHCLHTNMLLKLPSMGQYEILE